MTSTPHPGAGARRPPDGPSFDPPWWARNPHLQTMWGKLFRREVQVRVVSYADRMLATWNHADNAFPREAPLAACGMVYPAGEGAWGGDSASFFTGTATRTIAAAAGWSRGAPIVERIQVLPDGRCGVAIDGRMRWISPPVAWPDSTYVEIRGNSYRARALVGRVTIWTGVPPGVDWTLPQR